jgi:hypothetical protein
MTIGITRNFKALRRNSRVGENGNYFRQTGNVGSLIGKQSRRNRSIEAAAVSPVFNA